MKLFFNLFYILIKLSDRMHNIMIIKTNKFIYIWKEKEFIIRYRIFASSKIILNN